MRLYKSGLVDKAYLTQLQHLYVNPFLLKLCLDCHIIVQVFIAQYNIGQQYDSENTIVQVLANVWSTFDLNRNRPYFSS